MNTQTNPNQNLWNNNGSWWIHYTVHLPDYTKRRVRRSPRGKDVAVARARRDAILRKNDALDSPLDTGVILPMWPHRRSARLSVAA